MAQLQLKLDKNLYQKDPQSTPLGMKIIEKSILLIDELGFEAFTFRKLSVEIGSTEASIYRYFENKHRLLVYLITWYWSWTEYRIIFETHTITEPRQKLLKAIALLCARHNQDPVFPVIDEPALQRIVINESDKTYLIKEIDEINQKGVFRGYKSLCSLIAGMVSDINPDFPFPHALISTILEASHQQVFFARHLPSLTELDKEDSFRQNFEFIRTLVFNSIQKP